MIFSDILDEDAALKWLSSISSGFDHIFVCGDIVHSTLPPTNGMNACSFSISDKKIEVEILSTGGIQ
jgi:hypothetical protein